MKRRFGVLDALRGFAGLVVVLFHLSETYELFDIPVVPGHGYLAVEFFLLLTGFVLGHAYDGRWADGLGLRTFFVRRLVRLHPMAVFGTVLGFAVYVFFDMSGGKYFGMQGVAITGAAGWALIAALMIPIAGHGSLNPFNACSWTLYYEYVANILYALVLRRLGTCLLGFLALVAFGWSATTALTEPNFSLAGGWAFRAHHFQLGFVRTLFPLLFGLFLARKKWRLVLPARMAFFLCLGAFALVLFCPDPCSFGARWGLPWLNAVLELTAVGLVFPVLMLVGAGSEMPTAGLDAVGRFFGELSYPLYMTHFPFHILQISLVIRYWERFPGWVFVVATVVQLVLSVLFAWMVMRRYDNRVQRWLGGLVSRS